MKQFSEFATLALAGVAQLRLVRSQMITLERLHDDSPGFADRAQWLISGCIRQYKPAEVYIIRIRDWFDYKWCYFSGKMVGAVSLSKFVDLTLPPFVPNRVVSQDHYDQIADGVYEASDAPPLHIRQTSEENFKRFIRRTTNDGRLFGSVPEARQQAEEALWFTTFRPR